MSAAVLAARRQAVRDAYQKLVASQSGADSQSLQQPLQDFLGAVADEGKLYMELRREFYDGVKRLLMSEHAQVLQDHYDTVVRPHVPAWSFDLPVRTESSVQWYGFAAIRTEQAITLQKADGAGGLTSGFYAAVDEAGRLKPLPDMAKWIRETP